MINTDKQIDVQERLPFNTNPNIPVQKKDISSNSNTSRIDIDEKVQQVKASETHKVISISRFPSFSETSSIPLVLQQLALGVKIEASKNLLLNLYTDIKHQNVSPDVKKTAANLAIKFTEALSDSASSILQSLGTSKNYHLLKSAIKNGLSDYFNPLIGIKIVELIKDLQKSPKTLGKDESKFVADCIRDSMNLLLSNLINSINYQYELEASSYPLESLNPQNYTEKILSIQHAVVEREIDNFKLDLPKHMEKLCTELLNNKDVSTHFSKEKFKALLDHHIVHYFQERELSSESVAANLSQLTLQYAKSWAVDDGSPGLLSDLDKLDGRSATLSIGCLLRRLASNTCTQEYNYAISTLRRKFPETVSSIIDNKSSVKPTLDNTTHSYVISDKGIKTLLTILQEKGRLNGIPCDVLSAKELAANIVVFAKGALPNDKIGFVCRFSFPLHYFTIFVRKQENMLEIYTTDVVFYDVIIALMQNNINCTIFQARNNIRQKDLISCPVFAIMDLIQFCKYPDLLDCIQRNESQESKDNPNVRNRIKTIVFDTYPALLMHSAQSLSLIDSYDHEQKTDIREQLQKRGQIIQQQFESRPLVYKDINATIIRSRLLYEALLYSLAKS